jgi:exopolyphosphatase/guanosine-5'-triphosphate,3'-diphosphate pyrophosphatase
VVHCHSFPFGVLSLNQQFVKNKVAASEELERISSYIRLHFEQMKWLNNCQLPIIGTGGSARNLAEIDQALKSYPLNSIHQYEINLNDILTVKAKLTALSYEELLRVPGLSKERSDIIIPAIEVFLSIYKLVNAPFFRFSQKGIRDGLVYEEIDQSNARKNDYNLLQNVYYQMAAEYGMDLEKRKMVLNTVHLLFQSIRANGLADVNENDLHCLHCASYCYGLGEIIARDSAEAHTFYILANKNIDRLSHRDRIKIALLASYQSKNMFKKQIRPFKEWFTKDERQRLKQLGIILKISYILNSTKRDIVQDICFIKDNNGDLNLDIFCNKSWKVEQIEVEKQIKQFENAFGGKVMIHFKLSE